ncbi:MAG: ribose 5-phosphate isomerase B [Coriobacteriia bacterium]|nr:ribose 5-phosphate isomerase B [Coriobacteriia bacterium]MCL2750225.1 ribose 5-phosphate isomerase B [Coriobacteriia bacterium]
MKIAIACDHGAFDQKVMLVDYLKESGHEIVDFGLEENRTVDYPDYALPVAEAVSAGTVDRGVLVCGTGLGMAMAANKVPGIRAANVVSTEFAKLAREHNDANIITLSGRFTEPELNRELVRIFLETEFAGGHHIPRLEKIAKIEERSSQ